MYSPAARERMQKAGLRYWSKPRQHHPRSMAEKVRSVMSKHRPPGYLPTWDLRNEVAALETLAQAPHGPVAKKLADYYRKQERARQMKLLQVTTNP